MTNKNQTIIVTRHQGLVDWLAQRGIVGTVMPSVFADDVRGKHIVGALPLHLAAEAASVTTVAFQCPPELRGVDLTVQQLDDLGAKLETFVVTKTS